MLILVTIVVGARFWVRFKLVKGKAGADDWCILVAWVLAVAFDLDPINRKYTKPENISDTCVRCCSLPIRQIRQLSRVVSFN